jgi:hypothetical protein
VRVFTPEVGVLAVTREALAMLLLRWAKCRTAGSRGAQRHKTDARPLWFAWQAGDQAATTTCLRAAPQQVQRVAAPD